MDKFVIKTPRKESIATAPNNDKLLKRKLQAEKDKQYEKKRKHECQQTNKKKKKIDFPWLRYKVTLDNKISFCILCRKYPQLADQRSDSNLFVGKVVDRRK